MNKATTSGSLRRALKVLLAHAASVQFKFSHIGRQAAFYLHCWRARPECCAGQRCQSSPPPIAFGLATGFLGLAVGAVEHIKGSASLTARRIQKLLFGLQVRNPSGVAPATRQGEKGGLRLGLHRLGLLGPGRKPAKNKKAPTWEARSMMRG